MNLKLSCIAIDDEPRALDVIMMHCQKVDFLQLEHTFRDALEALSYLKTHTVDLIFLDINMPDLNGIDFLRSLSIKPMVIFTTAYSEYAVESYEFEAVDYLVKPILLPRFIKAVNKAYDLYCLKHSVVESSTHLENVEKSDHILVKSGNEIIRIDFNDLLYVEGARNYCIFFLKGGKVMSLMRMKEIEEALPSSDFIQVHKSYIISKKNIEKVERHQVTIQRRTIPIGNVYRNAFLKSIDTK